MENEKKERIFAILLLVVAVIVLIFSFINKDEKEKIDTTIKLLEDRNKFFEVSNSIDNYLQQVSLKNTDNLLKIFNSNYIKENNITSSNILEYNPDISSKVLFSAKKIYYQQIDSSIYKYYVKGVYSKEVIDEISPEVDFYVICYLYTDNMTFSIEPYSGDVFEGEI